MVSIYTTRQWYLLIELVTESELNVALENHRSTKFVYSDFEQRAKFKQDYWKEWLTKLTIDYTFRSEKWMRKKWKTKPQLEPRSSNTAGNINNPPLKKVTQTMKMENRNRDVFQFSPQQRGLWNRKERVSSQIYLDDAII